MGKHSDNPEVFDLTAPLYVRSGSDVPRVLSGGGSGAPVSTPTRSTVTALIPRSVPVPTISNTSGCLSD